MKEIIKTIVYYIFSVLRLPQFIDKLFFRKAVTILIYHAITRKPLIVSDWCFLDVEIFRRQMSYLKQAFKIVPLSVAIEMIRNKNINTRVVVVSFDDGFMNNYEVAYPILRKLRIPFTIFLNTQYINTDQTV